MKTEEAGTRGASLGTRGKRETVKYPTVYFEMLFVGSLLVLGYSMLRPFLPIFAGELDPAGVLVGFSVSSFFFARIFVELPSGLIMSRIGRRVPVLLGLCLAIAGPLTCALSTSIYTLILGLTLWGLGTALVFTSNIALIVDLFEPDVRGRALVRFRGVEFVGSFAGAPLGGFLAERLGYTSVFYITGASMATAFLVAFVSRGLKQVSVRSTRRPMHTPFRETLIGLKNWGLLATCVASLSRMILIQGIISTIFPIYLHDFLKMSVGLIGIIVGVRAVSLCLATVGCGHLSDKVGRKQVIFAGILIESFCIYLYTLASSFELILVLAFIEGFGAGMISVTLIALMSEQVAPGYTGGAVGLYRTFHDIGAVTGPVLIMMIQTTFDIYAGFLFGVALLLATVPTLLVVREGSDHDQFRLRGESKIEH
jgi:MFS family permease